MSANGSLDLTRRLKGMYSYITVDQEDESSAYLCTSVTPKNPNVGPLHERV